MKSFETPLIGGRTQALPVELLPEMRGFAVLLNQTAVLIFRLCLKESAPAAVMFAVAGHRNCRWRFAVGSFVRSHLLSQMPDQMHWHSRRRFAETGLLSLPIVSIPYPNPVLI